MPKLSKSEWQQVSKVAAGMDWTRVSAGIPDAAAIAGLNDRSSVALHYLLRTVAL